MNGVRYDCHVHVVGPIGCYPQLPTRTYLAGEAPLDNLRRLAAPRGITRFVVVQPSFYGADNTVTLEILDRLGSDGRGVAVIDPKATAHPTVAEFCRRGVRGLRLNLYSTAAGRDVKRIDDAFTAQAAIAGTMGWHVEVIAMSEVLVGAADVLTRSPVPVVIDHYGLHGDASPQSERGRRLIDLFALPNIWIKLSAPYRVSPNTMETRPDRDWLAAILKVAPGRCVWGSDWTHTPPHALHADANTALPYRALSYESLVDHFVAAIGDATLAQAVMVDDPARLYEF